MLSSRLLPALLLLLVLLFSVVAGAPARLLTLFVPAEDVVLEGVSGTVWGGSASRAMVRLPSGFLHLGAVSWNLHPLSLLTFSPELELRSDWGGQRLRAQAQWRGEGRICLRDVEGRFAADLLRQFAPLALGGYFDVQLSELEIEDNLPNGGEGRLVWERANWQSPRGPVALGTYALDFAQEVDAPLVGNVLTLAGPLEAEGRVELNGRRYVLDIALASEGGFDPQLREALTLMATPEGQGYRLQLDSEF